MALPHVNAVIVGAGAGGGIVAKELAEAGLSVVLLERGQWPRYDQDNDDELLSQRTPALGNPFGPDDARYRRVIAQCRRHDARRPAQRGGIQQQRRLRRRRDRQLRRDGVAIHAAGFPPQVHLRRGRRTRPSTTGPSATMTWSLSTRRPNTRSASAATPTTLNPFAAPRKKPYPMPAFPYNKEGQLVVEAAKRLGLHPFPIPMLRNSVPYNGRPACIHMRSCVGFACPVNAKAGSHNTVIPIALATGNCQVRTGCVAAEIVVDERGRARAVRYFDAQNQPQEQPADIVVVSASATETARLLLNSKSKLFPNGAGNNNDWVGRNLQGHGYVGAWGLMPEETYEEAGPGRPSPSATSAMATPAWSAAECWPTSSFACPTCLPACVRPANLAGARPTRISSAAISNAACGWWARSRKCPISPPASASIRP